MMSYPDAVFGLNERRWEAKTIRTKYGFTAKLFDWLEIHLGLAMWLKRGRERTAFLFDQYDCNGRFDYRYIVLTHSLGLPEISNRFGFFVGTLYEGEEDEPAEMIHFRVHTEDASNLLICAQLTDMNTSQISEWIDCEPTKYNIDGKNNIAVFVFSLARPNKEPKGMMPELFDNFYDNEPDEEDLTDCHFDKSLSDEENASYRLAVSEFTNF